MSFAERERPIFSKFSEKVWTDDSLQDYDLVCHHPLYFFFHNFIFLFHYPECFHWKWTKTAFGEWQNSFICLVLNSFTKYYLLMIPQMTLVRVTMSIRTNEQLYFPGSFKYFKTAYEKLHHYKAIQTRATEIVFKNVILAFYLKCILIKMAMSVTRNKRCW